MSIVSLGNNFRYTLPDHMLVKRQRLMFSETSVYDLHPSIKTKMAELFKYMPRYHMGVKDITGSIVLVDWLVSLEKPYFIKIRNDDNRQAEIHALDENVLLMYEQTSDYWWVRTDSQEVATLLAVKFSTGYTKDGE